MKVTEFINKLKEIESKKTVYMLGTVGQKVTNSLIDSCAARLSWYTPAKIKYLKTLVGKDYWAFDCSGLIKSVLWGWNGTGTGGYKYASNGVPDISADTMIKRCKNVSTDFKNIKIGNAVWVPGHIGIYVGDGLVIECTPKWKNNVQYTSINNKKGYKTRKWIKHGELPYLESDNLKTVNEIARDVIKGKYGNMPERKKLLEKEGYNYEEVRAEVNRILK